MAIKFHITENPLNSADFDLIAGFLNENFAAFSSYCEEHDSDANADQIVNELEEISNSTR